jgi:hypothetical protein
MEDHDRLEKYLETISEGALLYRRLPTAGNISGIL